MALIQGALGKNKSHYHSNGDTLGRCPGCYGNSVTKVGVITIDGAPQDVRKCNNCNRLSSNPDGGIQSLVDEAKEVFQTQNVGFTSLDNATNSSGSSGIPDYQTQQKFDNMNQKIEEMTRAITNLSHTIRDMATQNHDLMEKLMTDPLNGMRKAVSDFNLE